MKKTVLVIAAVAAISLAVPTAHASKVANPSELRAHHRAAIVPIGKCGDLCRVAVSGRQEGVLVILDNYNDHPVKIRANFYANGQGAPVSVTTRVPAHSEREFVQSWGGASSYFVSFDDLAAADLGNLGGITVVKPT